MKDTKPQYESDNIKIFEWPNPICEIYDKNNESWAHIKTPEDAKAIMRSLAAFLNEIPFEFGGYGEINETT